MSMHRPTKINARRAIAVAAVTALATAACGGGDEEGATRTTVAEATSTTSTTAPPPSAPGAPLTGVPADQANMGRPALLVKIDNAPKARPQAGIIEADVVFEEQVEGGVTRLAAVFHSADAEPVGPVRSFRTTDIEIAEALGKPLFAYSGANAVFQKQLRASSAIDVGIDAYPKDYARDTKGGRKAPYNLFTTTKALFAHAPGGTPPPPPLFTYRPAGQAAAGQPAGGVALEYKDRILTAIRYEWDAASGTYRRSQDGSAHVDVAGRQVSPKNVVVQFTRYVNTGFRDQSGAPVPQAELLGEGEAWVFTGGNVVKGRWRRSKADVPTEYVDAAGKPIALTPGQTWVELNPPGQATVL